MVGENNIKIGDSIRTSIKDAETLKDKETGGLHQEDPYSTVTEHDPAIATLEETAAELDHNLKI